MRQFATALACSLLVASQAEAQLPACPFRGAPGALAERQSPLDSVMMTLGDGHAKLCYGRPAAGGIPKIGGDVPFGAPWQMGDNEPTTLHLDFPARVGSVDVEPGSYSLYVIPEAGNWMVVVNANPLRWGLPIDAEVRAADIGSFPLAPAALPEYVDRLTFRFEPDGSAAGALVYEWERIGLLIPVSHR